jgi:adiponectin receptor
MRSPLLMKGRKVGDGGDREGDVIVKCCRRRCEFVSYDKLPEFLKHNEFKVKEALLSAFSIVHPQ